MIFSLTFVPGFLLGSILVNSSYFFVSLSLYVTEFDFLILEIS